MIGKQTFEIGPTEFLTGVTSGLNTDDGGLSPQTYQMNVTAVPGVIYSPGPVVDESTNVAGKIIASCGDTTYLGKDRIMLDDTGKFYWFDGSTVTEKADSTKTFSIATTDMVPFNGSIYATTVAGINGEIVEYDKVTSVVNDWWSSASHLNQGNTLSFLTPWRPLLVYEKHMYLGDANNLHRISEAEDVDNSILTLSAGENISALGIDQGSGRMLIATNSGSNYSGLKHHQTRIYVYDGFSNKASRVVEVEGLVNCFKNVGNTTFVFYGNKLGYWTGSGIEFLRTLNFTTAAGALINPHRACGIDNTLYYVDTVAGVGVAGGAAINKQIMAYGEIIKGTGKVSYPVLYPDTPTTGLTALFPVRGREIGYAFPTNKFYTFDLDDISAGTDGGTAIHSKRYTWPRPVTINSVVVEFDAALPDVNKNMLTLSIIDSRGNTNATVSVNPTGRTDIREWEFTYPTIDTRSAQFKIAMGASGSDVLGVRRMTVFYTPKE